jgi:hypothetical protein
METRWTDIPTVFLRIIPEGIIYFKYLPMGGINRERELIFQRYQYCWASSITALLKLLNFPHLLVSLVRS